MATNIDKALFQQPRSMDVYAATDDTGAVVAKHRVAANFKFTRDVANDWVRGSFAEPSGR